MFTAFKNARFSAKNRIVRASVNEHLATAEGYVTDAMVKHYERLAANNLGIIITGHHAVSATGRADLHQPGIWDDAQIAGVTRIAAAIHAEQALALMQISHCGAQFKEALPQEKIGPSATDEIKEISVAEIMKIEKQFIAAAVRAQKAGFDGVELHLAHGYLLSEFLDDAVNRREDEYGGTSERRFRICREIIEEVRAACGKEFLVFVKINADNAAADMQYKEIFADYVRYLDALKVDAIEVSGKSFVRHHPKAEQPYFLEAALQAKRLTKLPIILLGGLRTRQMMEDALAAGIDFVSLGRSLVCEPDYATKLLSGATGPKCIRCNKCFLIYRTKHTHCIFHKEPIAQLEENYQ